MTERIGAKSVEVSPALEASDDSDDEDYDPSATTTKGKDAGADEVPDSDSASDREDNLGDYDSGDEKTIGTTIARPKKRKASDDDPSNLNALGTDGGLVKTRAQRAQEVVESASAPAAASRTSNSSAIDALWAAMNAPPATTSLTVSSLSGTIGNRPGSGATLHPSEPDTLRISRTYEFAGEVHREEKTVLRDSAEARDFLASTASAASSSPTTNDGGTTTTTTDSSPPVQGKGNIGGKPLRRVTKRKSILDASAGAERVKKINTLEKSRLEWSSFVDREGIDEDLKRGNKNGYLDKQEFLSTSDRARYDQWKAGQGK